MRWDADDLAQRGFTRFVPLTGLDKASAPAGSWLYAVLSTGTASPRFLEASAAGWFKGKNPTVSAVELADRWVDGAPLLYVGSTKNLADRLGKLRRYAAGGEDGHYGGRYLWQVEGHDRFLIAWREQEDGPEAKRALVAEFEAEFGRRPFANLR